MRTLGPEGTYNSIDIQMAVISMTATTGTHNVNSRLVDLSVAC